VLSIHRARQGFVKARTAQANQIRGLLAEYGIAIPKGISHIVKDVPRMVDDDGVDLPGSTRMTPMPCSSMKGSTRLFNRSAEVIGVLVL
jgi:hypothetical protein